MSQHNRSLNLSIFSAMGAAGLLALSTQAGHALTVALSSGSNPGPWTFNTATNTFAVPATGASSAIDGAMTGTGILLLQTADSNNAVRFVDVNVPASYTGRTRLKSVDARFGVSLGVDNAFPTTSDLQFETTNNGSGRPVWLDLNGFSQEFSAIGHSGAANYNAIVNGNAGQAGSLTVTNNGAVTYGSFLGANNAHSNITSGSTGIPDGSGNNFSLTKGGNGTLTLTQLNSYTGDTTILGGSLSIQSAYLADMADVYLNPGAFLNLNFAGTDTINSLLIDGVAQATGTWGALGSGATNESSLITGAGLLSVSIPEPTSWLLTALGGCGFLVRRRRA